MRYTILFFLFLPFVDFGQGATHDRASEENMYKYAEQMPSFPGGEQELLNFIHKNTLYPAESRKQHIEGKVYVQFMIDTEGFVTKIKVLQSVDPLLDKEAIRVISSMPKWKPGRINDKNVSAPYTIPISFHL